MKIEKFLIPAAFLLTFFWSSPPIAFAQYLHRSGKLIVDGQNQEIILRGMGLGGWMLQEGYMLETNSFANPQHQIRAKIQGLIGETNTNEFYNAWLSNHCTKADIDSLAAWGFNSVRLPMHYNLFTLPVENEPVAGAQTWLEKGFAMTDSLLRWCESNQIYLILDLHAAPGGQGKDAAISDYDTSKPSLWESEANKQKTIALWRKLADRYKNETWIGGYDLVNETNWAFEGSNINGCDEAINAPLKKLLADITTAIRQVDNNHIIFIEGNCWANNHNGLLPFSDNNTVLSFHKYWNYNDQGSLAGFINLRNQNNVPLWLGESGENSNVWFRNAIKLMEDNHIGWAWWPMKKVGSVVNPATVLKNEGYQQLLDYWKNGGAKPSEAFAKSALMELAENLKIQNTTIRYDVIDAMFRQVTSDETLPFKKHHAPGVIHLSDYDLGRYGRAYADKDTGTYHVSVGEYTPWNRGWTYRNDGVDIQTTTDTDLLSNGHTVGWTNDNEWLQYTIDVDSSASYHVDVRYAAPVSGTTVRIWVNGTMKSTTFQLPSTGSYNTWSTFRYSGLILDKGIQKVKVYFEKGGANVSYINLLLAKKKSEESFLAPGAQISTGSVIELSLNKYLNIATISAGSLSVRINEQTAPITNVASADPKDKLLLTVEASITEKDIITVSYHGDDIKADDGTLLEDFSNLEVQNNLPFHHEVPGKIEAEQFFFNAGLQTENSSDAGAGLNIGHTDVGDYLDYRIRVNEAGEYTVEARIASQSSAGKIELQQMNSSNEVLNTATLNVPVTGGWQQWTTVSGGITLQEGTGVLRMKVIQQGFNLNWMNFKKNVVTGMSESAHQSFKVYPNPADTIINFDLAPQLIGKRNLITIRDTQGKTVKRLENINLKQNNRLDIGFLPEGNYIIEYKINNKRWTDKLIIRRNSR
jgi:endoglucanase